jgi:pimeloyl-ACP methyl ester carboxylesterase
VDLFGCGYDYRQSCRVSAHQLLARLQEVSKSCGGKRVDVVTHSMGGLVVRSLLADHPAEFEALVSFAVAVACMSWESFARSRPPHLQAALLLPEAAMNVRLGVRPAQVDRWVAIGCPFGGAPGWAVDGLVTGVQFGGSLGDFFFVQRSTFRQVMHYLHWCIACGWCVLCG